jgi:hypothetical protein
MRALGKRIVGDVVEKLKALRSLQSQKRSVSPPRG